MKYILPVLVFCLFFACRNAENSTAGIGQLPDKALEQEILNRIIRYLGQLPPKGATHENKFDARFDEHYQALVPQHRIDLYHRDSVTGDIYLLVSRIAPSMYVKRVGTGIHFSMPADSITHYNEVFRTWKMPEDELAKKGGMLFSKMVRGEDLRPFYPQNSGKEEYIEFPDANVRFDTLRRIWVSNRSDLLEEYR